MNATDIRERNDSEWFKDNSKYEEDEKLNDAEGLLDEIFNTQDSENIDRIEPDVDKDQTAGQTEVLLEYIKADFQRETENNRTFKWITVIVMMAILIISIIFLGFFMWKLGTEKLKINDVTLNIFITGVFVEVAMLVKIILESIFPKNERELYLKFIENTNNK